MAGTATYFWDEEGNQLSSEPGISQLPLREGLKIAVAGKNGSTGYQVANWHYRLGETEGKPGLHIVLRGIKQPWFSRLSEDSQVLIGSILVSLTVVPVAALALLYYQEPVIFYAFFGKYIRGFIAGSLFLAGALLPSQVKGWFSERRTLPGTYLGLMLPVLGIIAAIYWLEVSRPLQPLQVWPDDYAAYMDYLIAKYSTTWAIALGGVIPWIAFLLKIIGLEFVGKTVESVWKLLAKSS